MEWLWVLLPIVGFGVFFLWYFYIYKPGKKKKKEQVILDNTGIPGISLEWNNSELTFGGMKVMWNDDPFNSEEEKKSVFNVFDIGQQNAFIAMKDKFPTWDFNPGFVNIGIVKGNSQTEFGAESITMLNGLEIAGATVGVGEGYPLLTIIIPSQKPNNWSYADYVMRTIWHEYEHVQEYRSDTNEFLYWGRVVADTHPHHPMPVGTEEIPIPNRG